MPRSIVRRRPLLTILAAAALLAAIAGGSAWAGATIGSSQIIDNSIRSVDIRTGAVASSDLGTGAVTSADLGSKAVTSSKMGVMPYFRAGLVAPLNLPDTAIGYTQIVFDAESEDTANAYNPTTGTFTAPIAGIYHFEVNVLLANDHPPGVHRMFMYKNGVGIAGDFATMSTGAAEANGAISMDIEMAAGDTLIIEDGQDSNGADQVLNDFSWFSGRWVGRVS